jgi:hypothetical protein
LLVFHPVGFFRLGDNCDGCNCDPERASPACKARNGPVAQPENFGWGSFNFWMKENDKFLRSKRHEQRNKDTQVVEPAHSS